MLLCCATNSKIRAQLDDGTDLGAHRGEVVGEFDAKKCVFSCYTLEHDDNYLEDIFDLRDTTVSLLQKGAMYLELPSFPSYEEMAQTLEN
jgi:hypothetical protein